MNSVTDPAVIPAPVRWRPEPVSAGRTWTSPGVLVATTRGLAGRCPSCGRGALFTGWLRPVVQCAQCGAPLGAARADDAPPYIVIFIVAHLVIGTQILADTWMDLSLLAEAAIFMPATLALCLGLLRPIKGATIGLILHLGMMPDQVVQP